MADVNFIAENINSYLAGEGYRPMYARMLVALDGSACSLAAGKLARTLAHLFDSEIAACHIYGAQLHSSRFQEMEPDLPEQYQTPQRLGELREAHESLIVEGFQSLSLGYMEDFLREARQEGIRVREVSREGRNYVRILECAEEIGADLIILGAWGLGSPDNLMMGSTAARVLRMARTDLLIVRQEEIGPCILAGIDGSEEALLAAAKAADLARFAQVPLHLAAAYDLELHREVFKTLAHAISDERQAEVGLARQETLHETIIDDGLRNLYKRFLEQARQRLHDAGVASETTVLCGKAPHALTEQAVISKAGLIVLGRFGHHREPISDIGTVAETVARTGTNPNVLITTSTLTATSRNSATPSFPEKAAETAIPWDDEARQRLGRIPEFARPMAKAGIERFVRERGGDRVTLAAFLEVARSMGMG